MVADRGKADDCLDCGVMISLRALNGTGVGEYDDCLDGSAMISLRSLDSSDGNTQLS